MLDDDILTLIEAMENATGVRVYFGDVDIPAQKRPCIELTSEQDGDTVFNNTIAPTVNLPLSVKIVADRKQSSVLDAYRIFGTCMTELNKINPSAGWKIGNIAENGTSSVTFNQTYDESTFTITFPFNIVELL